MESNLPSVSVIIPARGAASQLGQALAAIDRQTYRQVVETVVAAADQGSADVARAHGAAVVDNPAATTPAGLNLALRRSRGEVIVRCDAQAILPPDYVEIAVNTMIRTGADVVGGMQVPIGETRWQEAIGVAMASRYGAGDARYRRGGEEGPVETVYLGVFRRDSLERLGGFDEAFERTQDYELNHRIIASGGIVWFNPEMRVAYSPRRSLAELATQYYRYGRAKRIFNRKHRGSLRWRQVLPPVLVVLLGGSLVASVVEPWFLAPLAAYVIAILVATGTSGGDPVRVALALMTMHISWGAGFLARGTKARR